MTDANNQTAATAQPGARAGDGNVQKALKSAEEALVATLWPAGEWPAAIKSMQRKALSAVRSARAAAPAVSAPASNTALMEALEEYWDAAWQEGREDRRHDTEDGRAQKALSAVYDAIYAAKSPAQGTAGDELSEVIAWADKLGAIGHPNRAAAAVRELASQRLRAPDKLAQSISGMVTEWVAGGIKMGTDWRTGLAGVIAQRLARFQAPVEAEQNALRAAQDAAVMPLIGPLLDAWENADREVMADEPELVRWLKAINTAMEAAGDADFPAPVTAQGEQP